eukprot:2983802-Rhodomonas_salina.5
MSGTDRAYGGTCAYELAMRCPVLTSPMVLPAMGEHGYVSAYARARRCPVLTLVMVLPVINLQGLQPYKIMLAFSVVDVSLSICLRAPYAMSGTDAAHGSIENCNPPTIRDPLGASQFFQDGNEACLSYAVWCSTAICDAGMTFTVLTPVCGDQASLSESFEGFVTKSLPLQLRLLLLVDQSKSIQVPAYARAMRCPANCVPQSRCAISLRIAYAMCGTDVAYGATRALSTLWPTSRFPTLYSYTPAMRCPVLTKVIVVLGLFFGASADSRLRRVCFDQGPTDSLCNVRKSSAQRLRAGLSSYALAMRYPVPTYAYMLYHTFAI